ncbi:MAG: hypothetical protein ACM3WV_09510 [Bacillota bacterium]
MRQTDSVLAGTAAGMIAAFVKSVPNFILFKLHVVGASYWQLAASVFLMPRDSLSMIGIILGITADIIVGGGLGLFLLLSLRHFGRDLWWYKGICAGNLIWLFGAGVGVNAWARIIPIDPAFRFFSLLEHQVFGLTTAYLIWRWTVPDPRDAGKQP